MTTSVSQSSGEVRTPVPAGRSIRRTLRYQPALDGVRGLAVLAVLLFHGEVPGFSGGYLGVSVFFTLSGFLITSLLVAEVTRTGEVQVGAFYARRARRLLPASIVCILGVVLVSGLTDWFDAVTTLRRDVLGSLLQVANWVFLFGGGSYQELFDQAAGATSPLEHYWSLAIEEQFYWLWPVAFVALARATSSPAIQRRAILLLTAVAAAAAPFVAAVWGADAAYWATPARAAEILMGASLAVLVAGRRVPRRAALLAPLSLVVLAICVVTFPAVGGPAYEGALPLVAVVSAALLLGLQAPGGTRRALSFRPLVWVGTISYGVYLYHWPLFVILDEQRTGLDGPALLAVRFAATFALAEVSFLLLERPIRLNARLGLRTTLVGAGAATVAVAATALVVVPTGEGAYWSVDDEVAAAAAIEETEEPLTALVTPSPATPPARQDDGAVPPTSTAAQAPATSVGALGSVGSVAPPAGVDEDDTTASSIDDVEDAGVTGGALPSAEASEPPPIPPLERPVRVLLTGDSTARAVGAGLVNWAAANPELAQVEVFAAVGCGFVRAETLLLPEPAPVSDGCAEWTESGIPRKVGELAPDVVAMHTTTWDVQDMEFSDGLVGPPTDPEVAARIRRDLVAVTERTLDAGAGAVVWIRQLPSDARWEAEVLYQEDPARHDVLYAVMDELAERHPGRVHVVDLPRYVAEIGWTADREARPDGVHWTPEAATRVADEYLGEQLIRAALDLEPS